jgi:hypothetical protein
MNAPSLSPPHTHHPPKLYTLCIQPVFALFFHGRCQRSEASHGFSVEACARTYTDRRTRMQENTEQWGVALHF